MNLISQLFFATVICTFTGTTLLFIWIICKKYIKKLTPEIIYHMLRVVCVFFLVPVGYILIIFFDKGSPKALNKELEWRNFFVTNDMNKVIGVMAFLWLLAEMYVILVRFREMRHWHHLFCWNIQEDDEKVLDEYQRISKIIGTRHSITVYRNRLLGVPVITGIFKRMIILPDREYTKDELAIIFYHELSHDKNRDLRLKLWLVIIQVIHCMNPAVYLLSRYAREWGEFYCDWSVRKYCKEEFTVKEYYSKIMEFLAEYEERHIQMNHAAALFENSSTLKKRLYFMKKYFKQKHYPTMVLTMLFEMFLVAGALCSYVSGHMIAQVHGIWYVSVNEVEETQQGTGNIELLYPN